MAPSICRIASISCFFLVEIVLAEPVGTAFTYQGHLTKSGAPYTGEAGMYFTLYDDPDIPGSQIGLPVSLPSVMVEDGVFTVELDFGDGAFGPDARWLEIWVGTDLIPPGVGCGGGLCEVLWPRVPITPAPVALYALNGPPGGGDDDGDWSIAGNDLFSALPGNVGIGTPLPTTKLHVETVTVGDGVTLPGLRTRVTAGAPNVIGGSAANVVTAGRVGATIAGGDSHTTGVTGDHGTIGGGFQHSAAQQATVSGGSQNTASAFRATVGGGAANVASATAATVGGGTDPAGSSGVDPPGRTSRRPADPRAK